MCSCIGRPRSFRANRGGRARGRSSRRSARGTSGTSAARGALPASTLHRRPYPEQRLALRVVEEPLRERRVPPRVPHASELGRAGRGPRRLCSSHGVATTTVARVRRSIPTAAHIPASAHPRSETLFRPCGASCHRPVPAASRFWARRDARPKGGVLFGALWCGCFRRVICKAWNRCVDELTERDFSALYSAAFGNSPLAVYSF